MFHDYYAIAAHEQTLNMFHVPPRNVINWRTCDAKQSIQEPCSFAGQIMKFKDIGPGTKLAGLEILVLVHVVCGRELGSGRGFANMFIEVRVVLTWLLRHIWKFRENIAVVRMEILGSIAL